MYNLGQKVGDKLGFSMNVLQLLFCNFLPKMVKIWPLGG